MSWAALPVEPACMGKAVGEAGRPPMFVGLAEQIKLQCSDIIIGAPHVDPILIKRIPRQGIVGIAIQLIGLKRMGRMLEYKNKQLYNKEE